MHEKYFNFLFNNSKVNSDKKKKEEYIWWNLNRQCKTFGRALSNNSGGDFQRCHFIPFSPLAFWNMFFYSKISLFESVAVCVSSDTHNVQNWTSGECQLDPRHVFLINDWKYAKSALEIKQNQNIFFFLNQVSWKTLYRNPSKNAINLLSTFTFNLVGRFHWVEYFQTCSANNKVQCPQSIKHGL